MEISNLPAEEDFLKLFTANGVFCHKAMFFEMSNPTTRDKYPCLFTLKPREYKGLPSAYQVYIDSIDEYDAAQKLCPNMNVWEQLCEKKWFLDGADPQMKTFEGLTVWRERMKARDASKALEVLQNNAASGDTTSAKALLANTKTKAPVGRKTKKETPEEKQTSARILAFTKKG